MHIVGYNPVSKTFADGITNQRFQSSAATDLVSHHANLNFHRQLMLRPRVLRNVKEVSIQRSILGCKSTAPFFMSPTAMARLAHRDGELAIARACGTQGIVQIVCCRSFDKNEAKTNRDRSRQMLRIL